MPRTKKMKEEVIDAVINGELTKKEEKIEIKKEESKPYFFPRFVAYIIDMLLVTIVCSLVLIFIPTNENYQKYMKEYEKIQTDFITNTIDADEYISKSASVVYDIDYTNVFSMIIEVVFIILYFIVFQFCNNGQTIGKKIMRLRVVSTRDDTLTLNQIAYRSLIINSVLVNILILGALLFIGRNYYYYISMILQFLASIIILITLMMILFRKDSRGLHDVITGTKVIQEN